ncbi:MAG: class I SAM-dependent methyltransferase [Verrucomicrobiae bacterium]|nr:class I SAM-dependent methyltransferase [Verrucomicrobiae bacterium]
MTRIGTSASPSQPSHHWDTVAAAWQQAQPDALWRAHGDAVNLALLARWLPPDGAGVLLKTDLFDEAVGDGLYPRLAGAARPIVGMDVAPATLKVARAKYHGLLAVGADVRRLPFADSALEVVVSNSTLDHFDSQDDIVAGLREFHRVLRRGGELVLTLDNPANPLVALRNALPFPVLHRLGLVPYPIGATCGPRRLRRMLRQTGFELRQLTAVMHCPRVIAVAVARAVKRFAPTRSQERFLRFLMNFERMENWPTRFLTGHFVAVHAVKP